MCEGEACVEKKPNHKKNQSPSQPATRARWVSSSLQNQYSFSLRSCRLRQDLSLSNCLTHRPHESTRLDLTFAPYHLFPASRPLVPMSPMSQPVDPSPFSDGEAPAYPRHTGEARAKECGNSHNPPPTAGDQRQHFSRPSALKPTRRRLQKTLIKPSRLWNKRGSQSSATSGSLECGSALATPESNTAEHSFLPMPTDLIDSKWLEYIERSGLMSNSDISLGLGHKTRNNTEPSPCTGSSLLPDFSHLSLRRSSSRPSLEHTPTPAPPQIMSKPRKSASKRSLIATPFKIGQLDGSCPRQKEIRVIKRRASIELIAEQYQAFLESRDADEENDSDHESEIEEGPRSEVMILEPNRYQGDRPPSSRPGSGDQQRETILEAPEPELPNLSPASDGTLVAFEEDAIYFKPVSFSPDSPAHSPPPHRTSFPPQRSSFDEEKPLPRPPSGQGNQPLQTAISLLVKELSSSLPQSPGSAVPDSTQSLQISTMIQAYQRLRDTVDTSSMGEAEERNVRGMFDCWLAALHTMNRSRVRGASVSERQTERPAEVVPPPVRHSSRTRRVSMDDRKANRLGDELAPSAGHRTRTRGVSVSVGESRRSERSAGVAELT